MTAGSLATQAMTATCSQWRHLLAMDHAPAEVQEAQATHVVASFADAMAHFRTLSIKPLTRLFLHFAGMGQAALAGLRYLFSYLSIIY